MAGESNGRLLQVKVVGDFALFTMPEMKAERVSYPVITPSSARGILEAIFWKPEFSWRVREIHVLKPIEFFSIMRNEVESTASQRAKKAEMSQGIFIEEKRVQRHSLLLRDVAYLIKAEQELKPDIDGNHAKYREQFQRYVARGKCFHRPYFGCREFACHFMVPDGSEKPVNITENLGLMLFDLKFRHNKDGKGVSAEPVFFEAKLDRGVLKVPQLKYEEVKYAA
jgi:CRISPR-associated protein Cas5d